MTSSDSYYNDHPTWSDVFGDEPQIALSDVAKSLGRNLEVLRRWTRGQNPRFRFWKEPNYPHKVYVPLSEVPVISRIPKGKGNRPAPWKTRAARLARERNLNLNFTQEETNRALTEEGQEPFFPARATISDGTTTVEETESPKFK